MYLILKSQFYVPISFKITPLIGTLNETYQFFRIVLLWSNGKYHCHGFENSNLTETKSKFHRSTFDMAFGLLYARNTVFFVSENNLKDKGHSQQPLLQLFFSLGKEKQDNKTCEEEAKRFDTLWPFLPAWLSAGAFSKTVCQKRRCRLH